MKRAHRGFTLIEVLITMAILTFLMGALFWTVIAAKQAWAAAVTRTGVRQELQLALRRIDLDLRDSTPSSITVGPSSFSFLSAVDRGGAFVTDPTACTPVWQKQVLYYVPVNTRKLLRKEIYGPFTGPLGEAQLTSSCDGEGVLLSGSVTQMRLVPNVDSSSAALSLELEATNQNGRLDRQSQDAVVRLRN